ncbi:LytTR family DNA-binding domain-containing protein [Thomasclavelia sp.]|uniref:LytR/AlgR family response regulator transcription factor n=1 Tax=Thomasclavelia sp. TaxID=3025757 RepID=UPI0025F5C0B3|nr:LytTR family DNA-binding domain-containing protein [Thomasclavelia sp.]
MRVIILSSDLEFLKMGKNKILDYDVIDYYNLDSLKNDLDQFDDFNIFILDLGNIALKVIELAKEIEHRFNNSAIIFTGSSVNWISDIYEVDHCYFFLKSKFDEYLEKGISLALKKVSTTKQEIEIKINGKSILIPLDKVIYLERNLRKTLIHLTHTVYQSYDDFNRYEQMKINNLYRCHRSFIVNLDKVCEYQRNHFLMKDGTIIPISRSHEKEAKKIFLNYLMKNE